MCDFLFSPFVSLFSEFIFFGGSDIYRRVEKVEHWDFAQHDRLCALHKIYEYVQQHREREQADAVSSHSVAVIENIVLYVKSFQCFCI